MSSTARAAAPELPIGRVLPLLPLPHLDREFDYLVPAEFADDAKVGVRVRIRFAGRLVDGFVVERVATTEHTGKLGWLDRVVSDEQVLTPEVSRLVSAVAHRYAGTRADVLRLAVPPRHAKVESEDPPEKPDVPEPVVDERAWSSYTHGSAFLDALRAGRNPRAVWQALPGEEWARRLAELAATCVAVGRSAVIVVPDQRDLDRVAAACEAAAGPDVVAALSAGLGPAKRYRRWLGVLRRDVSIVVGTRSAVFAPAANLGLVVLWDDGDDGYAEPRSPYPHAREVALLRAFETGCGVVLAGHARTAEAEALVDSGWAHDLVAPRDVVRARQPHVVALADSDHALARDPGARAARLPAIAFDAARTAVKNDLPVLVQVPRGGYIPSLACGKCRTPARCRRCNGPLALPSAPGADGAASPTCTWCGIADTNHRCTVCGSRALRAVVVGAHRTAEELGRAFPGVTVRTSGGPAVLDTVEPGASLVISTVGAEPWAPGGYGAALLLDGWALLGRADLRAAEEALRRWMTAAALVRPGAEGGRVVVVAESEIPTVQALVRWDPVGHARSQLDERAEVRFPPAVHVAAVDGTTAAIMALVETAELPEGTEVLGPVDLPEGQRLPAGGGEDRMPGDVQRLLLRVPRAAGGALAHALADAQAVRSARKNTEAVRVQIDPIRIG
ncbi:primosomal protein N' [Rhodococcus sp. BP-252]|uniref:primosomal protein N' n=1 Tax=unclassified Rhodococcus (in: high G+C Gram-positive bacteria) TaxID=192944 RepID=UPI001C9B41A2|nr:MULTISPECIES: primosomal protein N' [unclassified Rhodococcus (in: high G+C Gram-positive bacteria)]MBY6409965.1 primosomal protein N' [Rhodococcus sp. BP-320]MBY6414933.1 primosomal protein N' [Rhodococcus sp. BP-321]MBY6421363.1 primosomal protein N' [Rhodococcus sp. BP-324]MBY6425759.1 primosomal protein N' [Rhodococcus sp. BP-323]MBY6429829.1 primosomal protein N' [Rhodococcus sp. BP-322]